MAPFLPQERFPKLWSLFQTIFGATREKKRLALKYLGDHKNVIEIGCSVGVPGRAFAEVPGLMYLGIDIDPQAIEHAKARFAREKNLSFSTETIRELGDKGRTFDYVLFANILHHVDDPTAVNLISRSLTAGRARRQHGRDRTGHSSSERFAVGALALQARARAIPAASCRIRAPDERGRRAADGIFVRRRFDRHPARAHLRPSVGLQIRPHGSCAWLMNHHT